jgi:hypothetical protein
VAVTSLPGMKCCHPAPAPDPGLLDREQASLVPAWAPVVAEDEPWVDRAVQTAEFRQRYPHLTRAFDNERKPPELVGSAHQPDAPPAAEQLASRIASRTVPGGAEAPRLPRMKDVDAVLADVRNQLDERQTEVRQEANEERRKAVARRKVERDEPDRRKPRHRTCLDCGWVGGGPRSRTCGGCYRPLPVGRQVR